MRCVRSRNLAGRTRRRRRFAPPSVVRDVAGDRDDERQQETDHRQEAEHRAGGRELPAGDGLGIEADREGDQREGDDDEVVEEVRRAERARRRGRRRGGARSGRLPPERPDCSGAASGHPQRRRLQHPYHVAAWLTTKITSPCRGPTRRRRCGTVPLRRYPGGGSYSVT